MQRLTAATARSSSAARSIRRNTSPGPRVPSGCAEDQSAGMRAREIAETALMDVGRDGMRSGTGDIAAGVDLTHTPVYVGW